MNFRFPGSLRARLAVITLLAAMPALAMLVFTARSAQVLEAAEAARGAERLARLTAAAQLEELDETVTRLGRVAYDVELASSETCGHHLLQVSLNHTAIKGMTLIGGDGVALCSSHGHLAGRGMGDADLLAGKASERAVVLPARLDPARNWPVAVIATPAPTASGRGWLVAELTIDPLVNRFIRLDLPTGTRLTLVSGHGEQLLRQIGPPVSPATGLLTQLLDSLLAAGLPDRGPDGIRRIIGRATLDRVAPGYSVTIAIPADQAMMAAFDLRERTAGAFIITIFAIAVASAIGSRVLVLRRIDALTAAARRVAQGDFAVRTARADDDGDLADLAYSFDTMVAALECQTTEMRRREDWSRALLQHSNDLVIVLDADNAVRHADPAADRLLGRTPEELAGQAFVSLVHAEDVARVSWMLRYLAAEPGRVGAIEARFQRGASGWITFEATGINLLDDPAVAGLVLTCRDVTKRRETEERLALVTRAVSQSANPALIVRGGGGGAAAQIVYFNPAATELAVGELTADSKLDVLLPDIAMALDAALEGAFGLGSARRLEISATRPDGSTAWFIGQVEPLEQRSGGVRHAVFTARDVTEERRFEVERAQLEASLRQAQKMEAVGTLAGGIAHDFNNALQPMMMLTQLTLQRLPEGGRERGDLERVLQAQRRAKALVGQILAFSRGSRGSYQPIQIAPVLRETIDLLHATLPTTASLRATIDDCPPVLADATQIQQVVMNLCTNAVQALPGGKGEVAVGLTVADGACVITVSDTGCGIPQSILDRIFDPFFTTKEVGAGTGLGLSVVHGIVSAHQGTITVASTPGVGTTFTIRLPLID